MNIDFTNISDQLSEISQYQNENIDIFVCSASYENLKTQYDKDKKEYDNAIKDVESEINPSVNVMDIWQNQISKSIAICSPCTIDENNNCIDTGLYEIVAFAPNGRPIKITSSFSEINKDHFYIKTGWDSNNENSNFTYLELNLTYISDWVGNDSSSSTHNILNNIFEEIKKIKQDYSELKNYTVELEERLKTIEGALDNDLIFKSNNKVPTYLWTGSITEYNNIVNKTKDTTYLIDR